MTKTALIALAIALALPAVASAQNTNTNTINNTVTIGKPVTPVVQPPKQVQPPKPSQPVTTTPKPAVPKKTPLATASANGGTSNVGVKADSNSTSSALGGAGGNATAAGGAGGTATANAGTVTVNNGVRRSAASPTAPAMFSGADCSTSTSGSVTTGVLGLALGVTGADQGCEARQNFAIMAANGLDKAAAASFCHGTEAQQNIIAAQGIDCAALTGKAKALRIENFDMEAYCVEPIGGNYDEWRSRRRVCAAAGR